MNRISQKIAKATLRAKRVRSTVHGTTERPRLSVYVSNRNISAQIIDDEKHGTIVAVSTVNSEQAKGNMTQKASWIGGEIAKQAKAKKIGKVTFDRGPRLYHGRVKALADAARAAGLEF